MDVLCTMSVQRERRWTHDVESVGCGRGLEFFVPVAEVDIIAAMTRPAERRWSYQRSPDRRHAIKTILFAALAALVALQPAGGAVFTLSDFSNPTVEGFEGVLGISVPCDFQAFCHAPAGFH